MLADMNLTGATGREQEDKRKPYSAPKLVSYGGIAQITRNVGSTGRNDAGGGGMSKTA